MRETPVRGPAIDLGEFERRLRGPERKAASAADPLSELARLMQGEDAAATADPYSRILAEPRTARAPSVDLRGSYDAAPPVAAEPPYYPESAYEAPPEPAYAMEPDYHQAQPGYGEPQAEAAYESAYQGAEGGWSDDAQCLDYGQEDDGYGEPEARGPRSWLRPWHAVVAISLLAVASIGFAFWHRGGSDASREIATITAPEGPVKVKPAAEAETNAPETGSAVLDRREPAPVKQIVTHQEQAIDPTVAPKAVQLGNGPVSAPHEPAPPTVAPPRKVKTVTVRPDGSRVDDDALPPAVAKATRPAPEAAPAPAARTNGAATPPSAAKPATTPKTVAKPKPPAPPKVAAVEEPPAAESAEADAEPAAAPSKGGFAVQFGAAGSEAEARALMKTVVGKYGSALGGLKPTFKMATVGDKTVYRVRVAGMSKESANAICGKVKAGGGACFVAGN